MPHADDAVNVPRHVLRVSDARDEFRVAATAFQRLLRFAQLGHDPNWFKQFVDIEKKATEIRTFQALTVPGLLQLPEYALALSFGDDNIHVLARQFVKCIVSPLFDFLRERAGAVILEAGTP